VFARGDIVDCKDSRMFVIILHPFQVVTPLKILVHGFLNHPVYFVPPTFQNVALIQYLGESTFPNIGQIQAESIRLSFHLSSPKNILQCPNEFARTGCLGSLEFNNDEILNITAERLVFHHQVIEVADRSEANLSEKEQIVQGLKVMLGNILENSILLKEASGANRDNGVPILDGADAHGIRNQPTLLVAFAIDEGTPMSVPVLPAPLSRCRDG